MNKEPIPVLDPIELYKHHFGDVTEWKPFQASFFTKFHINKIEDYRGHIKFPLLPHRKTVFDFIFLTRGLTTRTKGLNNYTITENTFFFLPAFQITTQEFMHNETTGYYCHFAPEILNFAFMQPKVINEFSFLQFLGNPIVKPDTKVVASLLNILKRIEEEYNANQAVKLDIVSAYLFTLFVELKQFTEPYEKIASQNSASRITQQYKNALMQFIYEKQSVKAYAEMLCITTNHLNKCVKSVTGKSSHDLLDEMILLEVKAMLKQTNLSISEIAFKIGKEDPSDFTKFFKVKTGITPTEYRKQD